ncbi:MAG: hypothetical protein RSC93_10200 [Erysipelotrichaceae bacterium]
MHCFKDNGSNWKRWDLHVHTASSYDYKYKADDSDELLVKAWIDNEIEGVAITDHFKIDSSRINRIKKMVEGKGITIFPGVELRTDKGDTNIHLILIFDNKSNIDELENDFEVTMLRSKAKPKDNYTNETIYWDYSDIVEFAEEHDAIISIHTGSKANGLDKCISNALDHNMAVKTEFAETVDIFEVGRIEDVNNYKQIVFKNIKERPLIICSDNHDPRVYEQKEMLWIKVKPSFEGLKQSIIHPEERVYVGDNPPKLLSVDRNLEKYISEVKVEKKEDARNRDNWFDFDLFFNVGLTTIIGNKGSGKSALADIVGYIGKSEKFSSFSFLSKERFCRENKHYNLDYKGCLIWKDTETNVVSDFNINNINGVSTVQYLPQRFIEDTCNNLDRQFQSEIDKVIYSYVDMKDRGNSSNLQELIDEKQHIIKDKIADLKKEIYFLNGEIIKLERKTSLSYLEKLNSKKRFFENELKRHEANKPKEVLIPKANDNYNTEGLNFIKNTNSKIQNYLNKIEKSQEKIVQEKKDLEVLIDFKVQIQDEKIKIFELQEYSKKINIKFSIDPQIILTLNSEYSGLEKVIAMKEKDIKVLALELEQNVFIKEYTAETNTKEIDEDFNQMTSLFGKIKILQSRINRANEMLGRPQKQYQKYIDTLKQWEVKTKDIKGNDKNPDSLNYYVTELNYVQTNLNKELKTLKSKRDNLIDELFEQIVKKKEALDNIYKPIEEKLDLILSNIKDKVIFEATIYTNEHFTVDTLDYINQSIQSKFRGKNEGVEFLNSLIRKHDFASREEIKSFIKDILSAVSEDEDKADLIVRRREDFYNFITTLDYLDVGFSLKMGNKDLSQLSPGEKGTVLLIFYLALDRENKPLIIDQPEDNLDNQSVYDKLVPCVLEAKKNRQVILITHNPNLAIACDSELIICSKKNEKNYIEYVSGAIEDDYIKQDLVNILEGTMPAFDLRTNKYKSHIK